MNPSPNCTCAPSVTTVPGTKRTHARLQSPLLGKRNVAFEKPRQNPYLGDLSPNERHSPRTLPAIGRAMASGPTRPKSQDCALRFELDFPCVELPRSFELLHSLPAMAGCGVVLVTARSPFILSHSLTWCSLGAHLRHLCFSSCRRIFIWHSNVPIYYTK